MRAEFERVAAAERGQGRGKRPSKARTGSRKAENRNTSVSLSDDRGLPRPGHRGRGEIAPQSNTSVCPVCLDRFEARRGGRRQVFCSTACRELGWRADSIVEAAKRGRARGLGASLIERLKTCKQ